MGRENRFIELQDISNLNVGPARTYVRTAMAYLEDHADEEMAGGFIVGKNKEGKAIIRSSAPEFTGLFEALNNKKSQQVIGGRPADLINERPEVQQEFLKMFAESAKDLGFTIEQDGNTHAVVQMNDAQNAAHWMLVHKDKIKSIEFATTPKGIEATSKDAKSLLKYIDSMPNAKGTSFANRLPPAEQKQFLFDLKKDSLIKDNYTFSADAPGCFTLKQKETKPATEVEAHRPTTKVNPGPAPTT